MSDVRAIEDGFSLEEFMEAAEQSAPNAVEPKNGGASIAEFVQAIGTITEDYKPAIVVSFRKKISN